MGCRVENTDAFGTDNTTNGEWKFQTANLSGYQGEVKVIFEFIAYAANNYLDPQGNILEGVYLDDIRYKRLAKMRTATRSMHLASLMETAAQATFVRSMQTVLAESARTRVQVLARNANLVGNQATVERMSATITVARTRSVRSLSKTNVARPIAPSLSTRTRAKQLRLDLRTGTFRAGL